MYSRDCRLRLDFEGRVFEGFDLSNNQRVAIKVLFRHLTDEPKNVERARREASVRILDDRVIGSADFEGALPRPDVQAAMGPAQHTTLPSAEASGQHDGFEVRARLRGVIPDQAGATFQYDGLPPVTLTADVARESADAGRLLVRLPPRRLHSTSRPR